MTTSVLSRDTSPVPSTYVRASAAAAGAPTQAVFQPAAAPKEDTVQLSNTAQVYLQSQTKETQNQGLVEQLVRDAASGDSGALSLLTVI